MMKNKDLRLEQLESRCLLTAYTDLVLSEVVDKAIFYNNSKFDGNDISANVGDDNARASDKAPLIPGQTAQFQNYTSYSRGINGIMVDIQGLPDNITLSDFKFEYGKTSDSDTWDIVADPSMSIREGEGQNGSDRITFVWPDNTNTNGWLKVTVLATPKTGLKNPDVFLFGNAVAEVGNSNSNAIINSTDEIGTRNNPATFLNPASITNNFDFNRDGFVNATDQILSRSNSTTLSNSLPLLTLNPLTPTIKFNDPDGINPNLDGYYSEYSPTLVKTNDGVIISFAEGRTSIADASARDIIMRRSFDNGVTWTPFQVIFHETENAQTANITPVVDKITGTVAVIFARNRSLYYVIRSDDNGATWTAPQDITASVKYVNPSTPGGVTYYDAFGIMDPGPAHGIQLEHGPHAGRLIITAQHRLQSLPNGYSWTNIIYSDDHGLTWHLGGGMDYIGTPELYTNEATIVELNNGDLYLNMRIQGGLQENGQNYRGSSISHDGGMTWTRVKKELSLTTPSVQATIIRLNPNVLVFAAPDNATDFTVAGRRQMTVWLSYDEAQTWVKSKVINYSYAGYSDMTVIGPDTILLAFNSGRQEVSNAFHQRISFARFNLNWLEDTENRAFEWNFNEQPVNTAVQPNQYPNLIDDGTWDLKAALVGSNGQTTNYVQGMGNDAAIALNNNSDRIILTPSVVPAIQVNNTESLYLDLVFKTTDTNGVLIGNALNQIGWAITVVNGNVQFSVKDATNYATIISSQLVNDGNWHKLSVTRDRTTGLLLMNIDGISTTPVVDPTTDLRAVSAITLGSYNNSSAQLNVTVDRLRIEIGA